MMKVLIATDGSKHAENAARLLAHFSHSHELELTILSVHYVHEVLTTVELLEMVENRLPLERERAARKCQRIEQIFEGANATIESVVAEGHPGETIVKEAKERGVDLVVVGAVGHSLFERMMLGSVSDFVATHSPCSVLVVRPNQIDELDQRSIRICVAYDDSDASQKSIAALEEFDWSHNAHFDLVSVMTLPHLYSEIPIEIDASLIRNATEEIVRRGSQRLHRISPDVEAQLIESNQPEDGIAQFVEKKKSDLLVVGNSGKGLVSRILLGSVSQYLLRHAHCSVWIYKDPVDFGFLKDNLSRVHEAHKARS